MIDGEILVVKVKRSLLGASDDKLLNFEFKWSDNMQEEGNVMDFYVNGDVAPLGRFNYHYFVTPSTGISEKQELLFAIFPNPVTDLLNVKFPLGTVANSVLTIYSCTGQQVWQRKICVSKSS